MLERLYDIVSRLIAGASRIEVTGPVPVCGPALVVSNHARGITDGAILEHALGTPLRFVANRVFFRIPILGRALRLKRAIMIDNSPAGMDWAVEECKAAIASGDVIGIFPEGLGWRAHRGRFRDGVAILARRTGSPVVPVRIQTRGLRTYIVTVREARRPDTGNANRKSDREFVRTLEACVRGESSSAS